MTEHNSEAPLYPKPSPFSLSQSSLLFLENRFGTPMPSPSSASHNQFTVSTCPFHKQTHSHHQATVLLPSTSSFPISLSLSLSHTHSHTHTIPTHYTHTTHQIHMLSIQPLYSSFLSKQLDISLSHITNPANGART